MPARSLENLTARYGGHRSDPQKKAGPGHGPRGPHGMATGKPQNAGAVVRRILSYIGMFKKRLIAVFGCMLVSTAASIAGSYLLRPIINHIAEAGIPVGERIAYLMMMIGVMGGVYLAAVAGTYLQNRLMIGVSQNAIARIREDLFTKLQTLPIRFFDNESNGEIMSRFTNDVDNIGTMLDSSITSMISGAFTLVGTLGIMIYTNIWLTLITVAFLPVFAFGGSALMKRSRKYYIGQQAALGAVNGYIEENVAGQKVVKVFCHEDTCIEEFGKLNDDLRGKQQKA